MKTIFNRIMLSSISSFAILSLCLLVLHGCSEFFYDYDMSIYMPDNNTTFEQGDTITFSMNIIKEPPDPSDSSVTIFKGTIIQWTSDIDGDFWKEELDHDIEGVKDNDKDGWFASYSQSFSTSALSAGNHKITCKANARNESGTYNLATDSIRISVTESQTSSTTTTTTDGGGNLDVTACTAINDLVVRAGEPLYYNYNTECWASIILKNIGMKGIQAGFYVDDSTLDPTNDGWVFIYLDPGQEFEDFIQPSGWGYQPQHDYYGNDTPTRVVITSKITAIYSEDGCSWILKEVYATDGDVPTRTLDVSGLDPCN
jgi:hypothetical protein